MINKYNNINNNSNNSIRKQIHQIIKKHYSSIILQLLIMEWKF